MPKKARYKTLGDKELRHYSRTYRRKVVYEINPTPSNVFIIKTDFPGWLKKIPFKEGTPQVDVEKDTLIYRYEGKPTIHYDIKNGTFKVTEKDFNTYGVEICNNQANYLLGNIEKFSKRISGDKKNRYMKAKRETEWKA